MICPQCGGNARDDMTYCPDCGTAMTAKPSGTKRGKRPLIIGSCAAALLLVGLLAAVLILNNHPGRMAQKALLKTRAAMADTLTQPWYPTFLTAGEETYYALNLTGDIAPLLGYDADTRALLDVTAAADTDTGAMYMMLNLLYGGDRADTVLDAELSLADQLLAVSVPVLLERSVAADPENFISDWNASALKWFAPIEGETAESLQALLDALAARGETAPDMPETERYRQELSRAWAALQATLRFHKFKSQPIPGGTDSATMIQMTATDENIHIWLEAVLEAAEGYLQELTAAMGSDTPGLADLREGLRILRDRLQSVEFTEMLVNVYLDESKAAQCVEMRGVITLDGDAIGLRFYAGTADSAAPLDDGYAALSVSAGDETYTLKAEGGLRYSEAEGYRGRLTVTPDSGDAMSLHLDWNPRGDGDNLLLAAKIGQRDYTLSGHYRFEERSLAFGVSEIGFDYHHYDLHKGGFAGFISYDLDLQINVEAQDSYSGRDISAGALSLRELNELELLSIMLRWPRIAALVEGWQNAPGLEGKVTYG